MKNGKLHYLGVKTHPVIAGLLVILIQLFCLACVNSIRASSEMDTQIVLIVLCLLAEGFAFLSLKKKVIAFEEEGIQVISMWNTRFYSLDQFVTVKPIARYIDLYMITFNDGRSYWFEPDLTSENFPLNSGSSIAEVPMWSQQDPVVKAQTLTEQVKQYVKDINNRKGRYGFYTLFSGYVYTISEEVILLLDFSLYL